MAPHEMVMDAISDTLMLRNMLILTYHSIFPSILLASLFWLTNLYSSFEISYCHTFKPCFLNTSPSVNAQLMGRYTNNSLVKTAAQIQINVRCINIHPYHVEWLECHLFSSMTPMFFGEIPSQNGSEDTRKKPSDWCRSPSPCSQMSYRSKVERNSNSHLIQSH